MPIQNEHNMSISHAEQQEERDIAASSTYGARRCNSTTPKGANPNTHPLAKSSNGPMQLDMLNPSVSVHPLKHRRFAPWK